MAPDAIFEYFGDEFFCKNVPPEGVQAPAPRLLVQNGKPQRVPAHGPQHRLFNDLQRARLSRCHMIWILGPPPPPPLPVGAVRHEREISIAGR